MKKLFTLAIALIAIVGNASAQDDVHTYLLEVNLTDGTTVEYDVKSIESLTYKDTQWKSLGYCLYGEDFIASEFMLQTEGDLLCEYYVEVQENINQSGLYRLVNPYSPDVYPFPSILTYDTSKDYYIEINAVDPNGVYVTYQDTGATIHNDLGRMYVYSQAAYLIEENGFTIPECRNWGVCGSLKDGVITFPKSLLYTAYPDYDSSLYYANYYNNFKIDFNDVSDKPGVANVKVKNIPGEGITVQTSERSNVVENLAKYVKE